MFVFNGGAIGEGVVGDVCHIWILLFKQTSFLEKTWFVVIILNTTSPIKVPPLLIGNGKYSNTIRFY